MGGWDLDAPETPSQRRASENGVRLVRRALAIIDAAIANPPLQLTVEMICELHRIAMEGLVPSAGSVRVDDVKITGSQHVPPPWAEVAALLDDVHLLQQLEEGCDASSGVRLMAAQLDPSIRARR